MDSRVSEGLTILQDTFTGFLDKIINWLPAFIGALIVLILGFLVAKIGALILLKLFRWIKLEKLIEKTPLRKIATTIGVKKGLPELVSKLVYWTLLLVFLSAACNIIGLTEVGDVIASIFSYLPNIAAALIILILGAYIARVVKDAIYTLFQSAKLPYPKYAGSVSQVLIYVIIIILALDRLKIDTYLITNNISIIIGGFALAFAISLGLGSRSVIKNYVAMRSLRSVVRPNFMIQTNRLTGRILELTNTGAILMDSEGNRHYVSASELVTGFTRKVESEIT
ncbi:hypothetical protein JXI42_02090 [bacterium]|nr:hypothetical protein [bacterium]